MSVVVRVENVSKKYQLGKIGTQSMKGDFQRWWARKSGKEDPFARIGEEESGRSSDFWALKDISFDIRQGEAIGIIGKNGAGKSTMLKILSRITLPTTGRLRVKGRIASLLEVGTGFNPDLSGRENIFLNGAILGMTKREVAQKFDEIVDFSGVERFIDTPVKRYSSGMYVRLAFAVAAHLDSEVLILDEVLAVGDAEFQKKCLGKMDDVANKEGRTVIFVSHSMQSVRSLCNRALLLEKGRVVEDNIADIVAELYMSKADEVYTREIESIEDQIQRKFDSDKVFRFLGIEIKQNKNSYLSLFNNLPVEIAVNYEVKERTIGLRLYFDITDEDGILLIRSFNDEHSGEMSIVEKGVYSSKAIIPANLLAPRQYNLAIRGTIYNVRDCSEVKVPLIVKPLSRINIGYPDEPIRSKIQPLIYWENSSLVNF